MTLNLSPDAPRPEGNWGEIVWEPESMWVAVGVAADKMKYIWSAIRPLLSRAEKPPSSQGHQAGRAVGCRRERIEQDLAAPHPRSG